MAEANPPDVRAQAPSLTTAALIVAAGFLGSRVLGLLRSVIIAHSFGTSPELDAYWVAFRLPDLVFQLLAGATLASAFIPTFARVETRDGAEAAWRLASSVLNLVLLATMAVAALAFLLAPRVVPWLAPGLGQESGRQEELRSLAVDLTRLMLVSPVLFSVSGMFMGILNARRHFLTPAIAPMAYNLSIIAATLISPDVHVLAAGVVAGSALHLAVQLPDLRRAGMVYSFVARWRDAAVREVGVLMAPRILGLAAVQLNFLVTVFFASKITDGAISAVNFAWLILMTPVGVIGMAISTAVFPTLAGHAAASEGDALADRLSRTFRLIVFLSLPAGAGLALLAKPLIVVLLQRGAFGSDSTALASEALAFYALGLCAHTTIEILSRGYYALADTRTPVVFAVTSMILNAALSAALYGPLEVRGVAIALSASAGLEAGLLYLFLCRRIPRLASASLRASAARAAASTAAMAATMGLALLVLERGGGLDASRTAGALAALAIAGSLGVAAFLATAVALGAGEVWLVAAQVPWLGRRLPASLGPDRT